MFRKFTTVSLVFLLLVCTLSGFLLGKSCNTPINKKIDTIQDSVLINRERIKSLEHSFNILDSLDFLYLNKVSSLETAIKQLNKSYNEKKKYIVNLSNDSSFIYFSEWISKTDSTKW